MPDRFTAEEIRDIHLTHIVSQRLHDIITQAADTEEMVERIASADPALVEAVYLRVTYTHEDDIREVLRALAAVLKGEATNGE